MFYFRKVENWLIIFKIDCFIFVMKVFFEKEDLFVRKIIFILFENIVPSRH